MSNKDNFLIGSALKSALQSLDWVNLYEKLLAHTIFTLSYRYGIKDLEIKQLAPVFLSEILEKIYIEERKWNKAHYQDFYDFATSAIDSHIHNFYKKASNDKKKISNDSGERNSGNAYSKEYDIENSELNEIVVKELTELGADDDELLVFECMAEGIVKPSDISTELGIDSSQTNNILRRLRRKLPIVRKKLNSYDFAK